MCGIFGCINQRLDRNIAVACTNELQHRGPDGWGIWQKEGTVLGHRRLSILDLSEKGKQPMSFADGRYWITFNGEIYNFIEIKRELIQKGYLFKSDSDTEVILAAFCQWKEKCQEKFNGMWAFAIWDDIEKKLFLSRDRFGVKPLYYMITSEGGIAFASEMKALFPLLSQIQPNMETVKYFRKYLHYETREECAIDGIKHFPAGYYAWADIDGIHFERWWNTLDHLLEVPKSYEEQVELFRSLFFDACKLRMRSDVTLGTALSGGLDSSATICGMSHIASQKDNERSCRDWQHAYVACFPGTVLDETKYARQVTDFLGINSTYLNIDAEINETELLYKLYLFEDLFTNSPIPMMRIYEGERKDGTIVSIDGHGADELFAGYNFDVIKAFYDAKLDKVNVDMVKQAWLDIDMDKTYQEHRHNDFKGNRAYVDTIVRFIGKKILMRPIVRSRDFNHPAWKNMGYLNQTLYVSTHETILPSLLRNYDRCSMANGVEIRMPFLDYRIVQLAFSIGYHSKLHGGYTKSIIRDAMGEYMPASIAYRRGKIGFNAPMLDWIRGPYNEMFSDIVSSQEFKNSEIIENASNVKRSLEYTIKSEQATFQDACNVWQEISLYLWEQAVIKRRVKL